MSRTCKRCEQGTEKRLCQDCARERSETRGGHDRDSVPVRCTRCGTDFESDQTTCPNCEYHGKRYVGEEPVRADGGTEGAVDNDFDANVRLGVPDDVQTDPMPGGIAIDLVTRQPLFVRREVATNLREYYETEEFDLASYKTHPYLPVRLSDSVFECVFIHGDPERGHKPGDTYSFPRGRLMHFPVEQAWEGDDE